MEPLEFVDLAEHALVLVDDLIHFHCRPIEPSVGFGANLQVKRARERKGLKSIITPRSRSCSTMLRK